MSRTNQSSSSHSCLYRHQLDPIRGLADRVPLESAQCAILIFKNRENSFDLGGGGRDRENNYTVLIVVCCFVVLRHFSDYFVTFKSFAVNFNYILKISSDISYWSGKLSHGVKIMIWSNSERGRK